MNNYIVFMTEIWMRKSLYFKYSELKIVTDFWESPHYADDIKLLFTS